MTATAYKYDAPSCDCPECPYCAGDGRLVSGKMARCTDCGALFRYVVPQCERELDFN
jgi:hypothetical protein